MVHTTDDRNAKVYVTLVEAAEDVGKSPDELRRAVHERVIVGVHGYGHDRQLESVVNKIAPRGNPGEPLAVDETRGPEDRVLRHRKRRVGNGACLGGDRAVGGVADAGKLGHS